jgi:hypothetical protein
VRRFCLGRARRLRLHPLASIEQPPLGRVQQVVGDPLLRIEPRDRLGRLMLPGLVRA